MKKVQTELAAHFEEAYFRAYRAMKTPSKHQEQCEEELRQFLETVPERITVEDGQYEAIQRWIDHHIINSGELPQHVEIAILTYINSCK